MALTKNVAKLDNPGGIRFGAGYVTFDSSYATGGEALTPSDLGLDRVDGAFVQVVDLSYDGYYDIANEKVVLTNRNSPGVEVTTISGGSAGDHTVTGITTSDRLLAVLHNTPGTGMADLTAEFSITDADTINNACGTDTSMDELIVVYGDDSAVEVASTTDVSSIVARIFAWGV